MNAILKARVVDEPRAKVLGGCGRCGRSRRRWFHFFEWVGILSVLLRAGTLAGADPVVANIQVRHPPGTLKVEVTYDLAAEDLWGSRVVLSVSTNNGSRYFELTNRVHGNSWPVRAGPGQKLVWNPPVTWLGQAKARLRVRVAIMDDGAPPGLAPIKPGTFTMGSSNSEVGRRVDEGPLTSVTLAQKFWIGTAEVTQREWRSLMNFNRSLFQSDPELPVERVSWNEAMEYCRKLTVREEAAGRLPTGYVYRLPTEAEWEYACRAGTKTATAFGDRLDSKQANFDGNHPYNGAAKGPYLGHTTKVGSYPPNAWGLHDMHGNVWEWCLNDYTEQLPGRAVKRLMNVRTGTRPVIRGGDWYGDGALCRSASRDWDSLSSRVKVIGFRVVCGPVVK